MDPSMCSAHAETRRTRPTGRWGPELVPGHSHPPSRGRAWDPEHPPSRILGRAPLSAPGMAPRPPRPRLQPGSLPPCSPCTGPGGQTGTLGFQPAGAASMGPAALASCRPRRLRAWHVSQRDRRLFCSQNTVLQASSHKAAAGTPWRGSRGPPLPGPGRPAGRHQRWPRREVQANSLHGRAANVRVQEGQMPAGGGAPGLWVGAGAHSQPSRLAWASADAVLRTRRHHQSRGAPLGLGLSPHTPGGRAAGQGPGLHPGRAGPLTPAPQPSAETGCEKALYPPQHHLGRDRDEGGAQPSGTLASAPEAWRPPGVFSWADENAELSGGWGSP